MINIKFNKKANFHFIFLFMLIGLGACSDKTVSVENDPVIDEKKEEINQIAKEILPDNMISRIFLDFENFPESDKEEFLDSLRVSLVSLIDSTNKYFSAEELKSEILRFQEEVNKQKSVAGKGLSCNNDLRFGYAKATEISGNASASLIAGLTYTGGGGSEIVYDFVNMDRGVYGYSFCGVAGSLGAQFGASIGLGFNGVSKILTNIGLDQENNISRFSGPSISRSVGLSAKIKVGWGVAVGVSIGTSRGLLGSFINEPTIISGTKCPAFIFEQPVDSRSPLGISISEGIGGAIGGEFVAAIKAQQIASMSYSVDELYTDFGRDRWGRWGRESAGFKMALDIMSPFSVAGLTAAGPNKYDLIASAMAISYGFIDPSDCPNPAHIPILSSVEISNIETNSFSATATVIDDGNDEIIDKGFCWSGENLPDINDDCVSIGANTTTFSGTIDDLIPGGIYHIRPFAVNTAGIGYGDEATVVTELGVSGVISGEVLDAVTRSPVSNVSISIYNEQDLKIGENFSDEYGGYIIELPIGSGYRAQFQKTGYLPADYSNIDVIEEEEYILSQLLYIDEQFAGEGNISGFIRNALSSEGVSGITLVLRKEFNNLTGEIHRQTLTGNNGNYIFSDIDAGYYTVHASGEGYNDTDFNVVSIGGQTTGNQNAVISPLLDESEVRIVLTWGEFPRDLDSHLTGPTNSGGRFHIAYFNRNHFEGSQLIANLDRDDTFSFGPETITIYEINSGVYRYSVHDFSNRGSNSSTALSNSGAQVRLYFGNDLIRTFNVPPNRLGTLWTVFELNNNQLTTINSFSNISDPRSVNLTVNNSLFTIEQILK